MRRTVTWRLALPALAGMLMGPWPAGGATAAGVGPWTAIGPHGGTVVALAVDPAQEQIVYAVVETAGLLKSADGGASWTEIDHGFDPTLLLETVAVGPDGALYASGEAAGIWRSRDSGATWKKFSSLVALQFAFDARQKDTIYIVDGFDPWKSADGGATWTKIRMGLGPEGPDRCYTIAAHPKRSGVLLVGTSAGLFRSADGGATWQQVDPECSGEALLFDPLRPQRVYAGCIATPYGGPPFNGVVESLDGGATWQPATSGLGTQGVLALAATRGAPRTVYAGTAGGGVFRTTDAGAHWQAAASGIETATIGSLAISPRAPAVLYAGSGRGGSHLFVAAGLGIFVSADAGHGWAPMNDGIDGIGTSAVVGDSSIPGLLLAAAPGLGEPGLGVFRTRDGGARWRLLGDGLGKDGVADLSIDRLAAAPGRSYALGTGNTLYSSADRGRSWAALPALPADTSEGSLAADPGDSSHLLVSGKGMTLDSHDGGATWQVAATGLDQWIVSFAFSLSAPMVVYGGGSVRASGLFPPSGQLFRSSDGGASWVGIGPPAAVNAVAVDPVDPGTVYAATDDPLEGSSLRVSRDGGATWRESGLGGGANALAVSPTVPGLVFAGGSLYLTGSHGPGRASRVWMSADRGATWSPIDGGIPQQLSISSLVFDPAQPQVLYASTTGGVFRLDVGGAEPGARGFSR
ncbi:MAG TPA: hypothetical protein VHB47_05855 [Thermoanaerobaculia bacterium]|nr:hypothetical protein [Thermoanaerobaculia bacterium]